MMSGNRAIVRVMTGNHAIVRVDNSIICVVDNTIIHNDTIVRRMISDGAWITGLDIW